MIKIQSVSLTVTAEIDGTIGLVQTHFSSLYDRLVSNAEASLKPGCGPVSP
jgi:hypothetical protein